MEEQREEGTVSGHGRKKEGEEEERKEEDASDPALFDVLMNVAAAGAAERSSRAESELEMSIICILPRRETRESAEGCGGARSNTVGPTSARWAV